MAEIWFGPAPLALRCVLADWCRTRRSEWRLQRRKASTCRRRKHHKALKIWPEGAWGKLLRIVKENQRQWKEASKVWRSRRSSWACTGSQDALRSTDRSNERYSCCLAKWIRVEENQKSTNEVELGKVLCPEDLSHQEATSAQAKLVLKRQAKETCSE